MVQPWAKAGHDCICVDILHPQDGRFEEFGAGSISFIKLDLYEESSYETLAENLSGKGIIFGFPVCTQLAYSGARHWESKKLINRNFQLDAIKPVLHIENLAKRLSWPYMIENPKSALAKLWRAPDYTFNPYEYGGYLPSQDEHPLYPSIIPPRDAYEKETYIWASKDFIMPPKSPVQFQFKLYRRWNGELLKVSNIVAKTGGDSAKTKAIRSATPRGFATAVQIHNAKLL